jgi:hypothetical protein
METLAYDGSIIPGVTQFDKSGLTNGLIYRFKAQNLNYNGLSDFSDIASYYACSEPTGFSAPSVSA